MRIDTACRARRRLYPDVRRPNHLTAKVPRHGRAARCPISSRWPRGPASGRSAWPLSACLSCVTGRAVDPRDSSRLPGGSTGPGPRRGSRWPLSRLDDPIGPDLSASATDHWPRLLASIAVRRTLRSAAEASTASLGPLKRGVGRLVSKVLEGQEGCARDWRDERDPHSIT
jgi:hypothetical protein